MQGVFTGLLGCSPMMRSRPQIRDVETRLAIFGVTPPTISLLRETWPIVLPRLQPAIEGYLHNIRVRPWVAEKLLPKRDMIIDFYLRHYEVLFQGWFDQRYAESYQRKEFLDDAIDFHDSRTHVGFGQFVIQASIDAISKHHWLWSSRASAKIAAVTQVVAFDNVTALVLHIDNLIQSSDARRSSLDKAITKFDTAILAVTEAIKDASTSLLSASVTMREITENTTAKIDAASSAAMKTSESVAIGTAATEDIATSINEIRSQAVFGAEKARTAGIDAKQMNSSVRDLTRSVERVGSVVGMIADIASQTNLLALNATIEAARAGLAGKGFAVVAAEVKALANQTSRATDDIATQITDIQSATLKTVSDIDSMAVRIAELAEIASNISVSIEEQTRVTADIGGGMQSASDQTMLASREMNDVQTIVQEGTVAAAEISKWAKLLSEQANDLSEEVKTFFSNVRAA